MKTLFSAAHTFALIAHGVQKYGQKPYHAHLFDVVGVLKRFVDWETLTQEMIDAAWLHDVLEDTPHTRDHLERMFGKRTVDLVHAVTNEKGPNRKARGLLTYPKIRETSGAIIIKLSDRIANVENCVSHDRIGKRPGKLFNMYLREKPDFEAELRERCRGEGAVGALMWKHLDQLFEEGQSYGSV